jgi:hypothetical protein
MRRDFISARDDIRRVQGLSASGESLLKFLLSPLVSFFNRRPLVYAGDAFSLLFFRQALVQLKAV